MIIKSLKGDGLEHLAGQVHVDVLGWEWLSSPLVSSGIDPDTGEESYHAAPREIVGQNISIELENDSDNPVSVAFSIWYQKEDFSTAVIGCSPVEIKPGESRKIEPVFDKKRIGVWCLIKV